MSTVIHYIIKGIKLTGIKIYATLGDLTRRIKFSSFSDTVEPIFVRFVCYELYVISWKSTKGYFLHKHMFLSYCWLTIIWLGFILIVIHPLQLQYWRLSHHYQYHQMHQIYPHFLVFSGGHLLDSLALVLHRS